MKFLWRFCVPAEMCSYSLIFKYKEYTYLYEGGFYDCQIELVNSLTTSFCSKALLHYK